MQNSKLQDTNIEIGELSAQPFGFSVGKARQSVTLALSKIAPAFLYLVHDIIQGCTSKKMRRIAARWIVAVVADNRIADNFSVSQGIGNAVSTNRYARYRELPVTFGKAGTHPQPAFIHASDRDFKPKSFSDGLMFSDIVVMIVEKAIPWFCYGFTTSAFAQFSKFKFGLNQFWGIILHDIRSFQRVSGPGIVTSNRPVFLCVLQV